MYLILSSETDITTNHVIEWLIKLNHDFVRINQNDKITFEKILLKNNKYEIILKIIFANNNKTQKIKINKIKGYWYRRDLFNIENFYLKNDNHEDFIFNINKYKNRENESILGFLHYYLNRINHINSFNDNNFNKLINLMIAGETKIKIPQTLITNNKKEVIKFKKQVGGIITKATRFGGSHLVNEIGLGVLTNILDDKTINKLPDYFDYSTIQEFIEKKYDIRTFYLKGNFYSAAILSQNKSKTKIDFRSDQEGQTRTVPFKLPKYIETEMIKIFNKLELNCCSIDFVIDKKNILYFLEINPVGQFGFVSKRCNYNLEKIMMEELTKNGK